MYFRGFIYDFYFRGFIYGFYFSDFIIYFANKNLTISPSTTVVNWILCCNSSGLPARTPGRHGTDCRGLQSPSFETASTPPYPHTPTLCVRKRSNQDRPGNTGHAVGLPAKRDQRGDCCEFIRSRRALVDAGAASWTSRQRPAKALPFSLQKRCEIGLMYDCHCARLAI